MRPGLAVISVAEIARKPPPPMPHPSTDDPKRAESISELVQTEVRYERRLQTLARVFHEPAKLVLPGEDAALIFQELPELVSTSQAIIRALEAREHPDQLGALGTLTAYCIGHRKANDRLAECARGSRKFARLLADAHQQPECEGLDLGSFLLEPVQRLARYPLLLRQILHYTPKTHPDHVPVLEALLQSEELLRGANEAVRSSENMDKLREIQARLGASRRGGLRALFRPQGASAASEAAFDVLGNSARQHLHSAALTVGGRRLEAFLFSDILLLAKAHSGGALELAAEPVLVEAIGLREDALLVGDSPAAGDDPDDTQTWIYEVKKAQRKHRDGQKTTIKPALQLFTGSLEVTLLDTSLASGLPLRCSLQLGYQEATSGAGRGRWGEMFALSVPSFDEELVVDVFYQKPFAPRTVVGRTTLALHFLEYASRRTPVCLDLLASGSQAAVGKLNLELSYKSF